VHETHGNSTRSDPSIISGARRHICHPEFAVSVTLKRARWTQPRQLPNFDGHGSVEDAERRDARYTEAQLAPGVET